MKRLPFEKRCQLLQLLVEGNSLRGISRILGISINTVLKFVVDMGQCAREYQNLTFQNLPCRRIQVDEIWSFCYARKKNLPDNLKYRLGYGDLWTWIAMDPDTKLVPCWMVGDRTQVTARLFMKDLASRLSNRIQLSSDGWSGYVDAVKHAFDDVDHGLLVKRFGDENKNKDIIKLPNAKKGCTLYISQGAPAIEHIKTNAVERQNLTLRMSCKRFARQTNAHSKKAINHMHAISIHYLWYNFGRVHQTLKTTPAMAAGLAEKAWTIADLIRVLERWENDRAL